MTASDVIGSSLIKARESDPDSRAKVLSNLDTAQAGCPTLLEALQVHLDQKGKGRPKTLRIAAQRSCNYVISLCGNKPLSSYTRQDALMFRDWLVKRGLTGSSVTRNFSYVKAVINFALSEFALGLRNPFIGVYHDRTAGVLTRKLILAEDIKAVQLECRGIDDDLRWLVAMLRI